MNLLTSFAEALLATLRDVTPIAIVLVGFQILVLRRPVKHFRQIMLAFVFVLLGLTLFLEGLEIALFPLGKLMAAQLTAPEFLGLDNGSAPHWSRYLWVYLFAAALGFSTTIAEPSLIAVAIKANQVSAGVIGVWGLRIAVAVGVAIGIALGSYRIVSGTPLAYYILAGYVVVLTQTLFAPKAIVALAYDSGGVTTSTVTVPLVTALGLGLSHHIPGRDPLVDGFGLIAFASLFPIMTVIGYAQIGEWYSRRARGRDSGQGGD